MGSLWTSLLLVSLWCGELEADLKALIDEFDGHVSVAMTCPSKGISLMIAADRSMHAASTIKTPVMMRLFERIERGELALDTQVMVRNKFKSIVDGSAYQLKVNQDSEPYLYQSLGKKVALKTLIETMIIHSSNLATNLLIELADPKSTTAMAERIGGQGVAVLRGVEDLKAYEKGLSNKTTAQGMLAVMMACANHSDWQASHRETMLDILSRSVWRGMIPAGLPKNSGIRIANKEGQISTVQHDAAIIDLADGTRYGLVILTEFKRGNPHKKAYKLGRKISKRIYEEVIAAR